MWNPQRADAFLPPPVEKNKLYTTLDKTIVLGMESGERMNHETYTVFTTETHTSLQRAIC